MAGGFRVQVLVEARSEPGTKGRRKQRGRGRREAAGHLVKFPPWPKCTPWPGPSCLIISHPGPAAASHGTRPMSSASPVRCTSAVRCTTVPTLSAWPVPYWHIPHPACYRSMFYIYMFKVQRYRPHSPPTPNPTVPSSRGRKGAPGT